MRKLLLLLLLVPGLAAAQAGRFILAVGDVVVARGVSEIRPGIGTAVESGDTIRVGVNSNAQIRLSDESIIGLRPGTVLRLDEYAYSGSVDGKERNIFSLLKGGFRTVTGAIGRLQSKERYQVRTATATVGIRGTHYTLVVCDNDCDANAKPSASAGQTGPGGGVPNGTYGGVSDGRIGVENQTGERIFGANEFFYVASQDSAPQSLIAPPSFLYDRLAGQTRNQGQKGQETSENMAQSGMNAESRPSEVPAPPAPNEFVVTEQRTAAGTVSVVASVTPTIAGVGALTQFVNPDPSDGGGFFTSTDLQTTGTGTSTLLLGFKLPGTQFAGTNPNTSEVTTGAAGSAGNVINETSANSLNVFWGRWIGGTFTDNSGTTTLSTNNQFHYMVGPLTPPEVFAAKSGSFLMSPLFGTTPTNNLGESGTFGFSSPFGPIVNFTARTVSFPGASYGFTSQTWSFPSSSTALQIRAGQGAFIDNVVSGGTCAGAGCSGSANLGMTGIFMGPKGDHLGISFNARTTSGPPAGAQSTKLFTCSPSC